MQMESGTNDSDDDDYRSTSDDDDSDANINNVELPVAKHKHQIIKAVKDDQVVILFGKTGCGKSTKVPQYLLEAGLNNKAMIGITQPRRICAVSIAKRIAKERKCRLGREVGYQVRFDRRVSASSKIVVMTEGILLNEFRSDMRLHDYGVIIIDEAHERSTNCEILLGLLKSLLLKRSDLRIIICSATINAGKFLDYFSRATVIEIIGRPHQIEVIYMKGGVTPGFVLELEGDILIFEAGVSKVVGLCWEIDNYIKKCNIKNVLIYALYSGIGIEAQLSAIKPCKKGKRKIVISTNIAESSVTIEGISVVIDTGFYKRWEYHHRLDLDVLVCDYISKAQAEQRRGRSGRTKPGKCYRMYAEKRYQQFSDDYVPAIFRENLADMFLGMKLQGLDPWKFNYLDQPKKYSLQCAEEELRTYSLIHRDAGVTPHGRDVADLPIGLRLGKVILDGVGKDSFYTTLCICALLTQEYVFPRPWKDEEIEKAERRQKKFYDKDGDHFTLLRLYREWKEQENQKRWCHKHVINLPIMKEVDMIVEQIYSSLRRRGARTNLFLVDARDDIKKSFVSVFYRNISFLAGSRLLKQYDSQIFEISKYSRFETFESPYIYKAFTGKESSKTNRIDHLIKYYTLPDGTDRMDLESIRRLEPKVYNINKLFRNLEKKRTPWKGELWFQVMNEDFVENNLRGEELDSEVFDYLTLHGLSLFEPLIVCIFIKAVTIGQIDDFEDRNSANLVMYIEPKFLEDWLEKMNLADLNSFKVDLDDSHLQLLFS